MATEEGILDVIQGLVERCLETTKLLSVQRDVFQTRLNVLWQGENIISII